MVTIDPKVVPLTRLMGLINTIKGGNRYGIPEDERELVISRIQHDMRLGIVYPRVFREDMMEPELLEPYRTGKHDDEYGVAMALEHGMNLPFANAKQYNPLKYTHREGKWLRDTSYYMHLRGIGAAAIFSHVGDDTDGLNHINIYSDAKTFVGACASNFTEAHHETRDGAFRTLEGYYHWLRIRDWMRATNQPFANMAEMEEHYPGIRRLRNQSGPEAIRDGRKLKSNLYGGTTYKVAGFSDEATQDFKWALAYKLHTLHFNNVTLGNYLSCLVYSGFPLKHYYVYQGKAKFPAYNEWLPNILTALLEHIDPNSADFDLDALQAKIIEGSV